MTPHERLDAAMNRRRLDLGVKWSEVARTAGVSEVTIRAIRRGDNQPSDVTQRRLEDALQWPHGTIADILAGRELPEGGEALPKPEQLDRLDRAERLLAEAIELLREARREAQ